MSRWAVPPPTSPHGLSQDTQEQETTQGRPWLTKIFRHSTSPIIIYYPPSTFTHVWLHTKSPGHNLWKQTKRKKKIHASKHPFIHPLHPINRSLVVWLHSKFHEGIEDSDYHCQSEIGPSNNGFLVDLGHRILSFQVPLETKIDSQVDICWILLRGDLLACGLRELHFCWISSVSWKKLAASS